MRVALIQLLGRLDTEQFGLNRRPDHPVRQAIEDCLDRLRGSTDDPAVIAALDEVHPVDGEGWCHERPV